MTNSIERRFMSEYVILSSQKTRSLSDEESERAPQSVQGINKLLSTNSGCCWLNWNCVFDNVVNQLFQFTKLWLKLLPLYWLNTGVVGVGFSQALSRIINQYICALSSFPRMSLIYLTGERYQNYRFCTG